ncbi:MAG: TonB-dependent receptor [Burkholderiales bacterium]|nr:TonB-dependent receptor [Burkholderiales bacterium]
MTLTTVPAALLAHAAAAQSTQPAPASTVVITGNPLGNERTLLPSAVLSGNGLALRRAATLGETLDGLPGVAATGFGPNASRPVIRGLDGDRVRMLDNGGASVDASSLSFDHAVALDPLVVERLEVLRGPAVLLYGGSATGGVVNAINNRIPRALSPGLAARAELRGGGAASERSGAALLEGAIGPGEGMGGGTGLAWHADAFGRRTEDQRTPTFTPLEDGTPLEPADRVRNSASRSEGGALGASFVGGAGHAGLSAETFRNRYGVTVEPEVTIRMQRERQAFSGGWKPGLAGIEAVAIDAAHTRYRHEEVEGTGEVGTTFESRADDARVELRHAPLAGLRGVFGGQWEQMDFSALGEEAFVPGTQTRSQAAFVLEEYQIPGAVVLSAGLRGERVRVASAGDAADAAEPRFGAPSERRFSPRSISVGARVPLPEGWSLSASWASSQRAPTYYELFANGVHVATAAFERGDAALAAERSRHTELGLAWTSGPHKVEVQWFTTRFANYIAQGATGADMTIPGENPGDPDEVFPEYAFRAVRARLRGFELEAHTRLLTGAPVTLDLSFTLDQVKGDNLDAGEPLPRIAPLRARLSLEASRGGLRGGMVVRHAARQDRVPATDTATPGYTMLDLWAGLALPLPDLPGEGSVFVKAGNVTDRLGYNASSIATMRGLAPLPGRALSAGLRWRW